MENGVLTRRGNSWFSESSVFNILTHTHYKGYYFYEDKKIGEQCRSSVPELGIDKVILKLVQDRVGKRKHGSNNIKHETLLKDFLECSHCGSRFGQRINKSKYYNHYYCRGNEIYRRRNVSPEKICVRDGGNVRSINIEDSDRLVWDTIMGVLFESHLFKEVFKRSTLDPIYEKNAAVGKSGIKEKNRIKRKIESIKGEVNELDNLIQDRLIDELLSKGIQNKYKNISLKIEERKTTLESKIEGLENDLYSVQKESNWVNWVRKFGNRIEDLKSGNITLEKRKSFLEGVIRSVKVTTVDSKTHRLELVFTSPYVGDHLEWTDPDNMGLGYSVIDGSNRLIVSMDSSSKRQKKTD